MDHATMGLGIPRPKREVFHGPGSGIRYKDTSMVHSAWERLNVNRYTNIVSKGGVITIVATTWIDYCDHNQVAAVGSIIDVIGRRPETKRRKVTDRRNVPSHPVENIEYTLELPSAKSPPDWLYDAFPSDLELAELSDTLGYIDGTICLNEGRLRYLNTEGQEVRPWDDVRAIVRDHFPKAATLAHEDSCRDTDHQNQHVVCTGLSVGEYNTKLIKGLVAKHFPLGSVEVDDTKKLVVCTGWGYP